uniref:Protein kinase domain-containing protein n=1 Tax=Rhizophagus irregularis (strain DAOM 181602 / DAOM 197198 / MUCL 43194) TaxID=747089 RepID=U9TQB5_RHIID
MDLGIKETTNLSHVKKCEECNRICYVIRFQQNFKNWTSGNNDIDKFIQDTQLSSHNDLKEALEWIPYNRLYYIKYIAEDEFGEVYKANWIDGNISCWNNENKNWKRYGSKNVILKSLNNLKNIRIKLMDEV